MRVGQVGSLANKLLQDFRRKNKTSEVNSFSLLRMFSTYVGSNPKELMEGSGSVSIDRPLGSDYDK
jgi:hypothetical protein